MNADDCIGFDNLGSFLQVMQNWSDYHGEATYMIVLSQSVSRFMGSSDILYIGETNNLGGNDRSRLWNYCYAIQGTNEWRMKNYCQQLENNNAVVNIYVCSNPPDGATVREYEGALLKKYRECHWELPPWNSQG